MSPWTSMLSLLFTATVWGGFAHGSGFSGQLKSITDDYPTDVGPPTEPLIPYISLDVSDKFKISKSWRFQTRATLLTNTVSSSPPENFYGDIPEMFFESHRGETKFRFGLNTVNWAVVDLLSPSDVVNTLALFHPLRPIKQGAPMAELIYGPEELNIDLLFIPVQRAPQLPSKDSRWLPRQFTIDNVPGSQISNFALPPGIQYQYTNPQALDRPLNDNFGGKLASHIGNLDLQLTYFNGAANTPKIRPINLELEFGANSNQAVAISPIVLSPVNYRIETTGIGFVWAHESFILRGESAYTNTLASDPLLQSWMWSNVLGVETNVPLGTTTLTLLAQYYYTKNPQTADDFISSAYRLFDHTPMIGARWAYSDNLTFILSALYEPTTDGMFGVVGFDQKIAEHLKWGVSWREFTAQKQGLLKTYSANSHGTLELTYLF